MNYNTTKEKITAKEYGRHVQEMVDYLMTIEDKEVRNLQAKATIRAMSCFSPGMKDTADYWQKLWDHLFLISDFKLDIDSPFPKPAQQDITGKPQKIPYKKNNILFPPYGKFIENIIKSVAEEPESEAKRLCVENIAVLLKKQYLQWNRDSVNDNLIIEHLNVLSDGKLTLREDFVFPLTKELLEQLPTTQVFSSKNNNKNNNKKVTTQLQQAVSKKKKKKKPKKKNNNNN